MPKYSALTFGLIILACCAGCTPPPPLPAASSVTEPEALENPPDLPLSLEIEKATNDGERLHVAAAVSARADWDASTVVLVLRGLKHGELVAEKAEKLLDHVPAGGGPPVLRAGEQVSLSIAIPVAQVEEYQLELLWGDDAEPWVKERRKLAPADVEVSAVRLECRMSNCAGGYYVHLTLLNRGTAPVEGAVLRVGFAMLESAGPEGGGVLDLSGQALDNEKEVRVYPLSIQPGRSQAIRLVFNAPFTKAEGAQYLPVVKVIAVN